MRCLCGMTVPLAKAPSDHRCLGCGKPLIYQTDDYLLHGANGLVKEIRPGQVEMGRMVEKGLTEGALVFVEGPVGSGKSFGYIVPAILLQKRTVISTAKKQLQHQLARKDLPYLSERMERVVPVALLKGKSNYACRVKLYDIPKDEQADFKDWLEESEYGDLTDYPGKRPFFWSDVTAEDCVGSACKFAKNCGYWRSKQQAKTAQIIIANHHVTAFDLRFGPGKLLGPYDNLIIDEAHQAPAAFRGAYSKTLTNYSVKRLIKQIDKAGMSIGVEKKLEDTWDAMFDRIRNMDGEIPKDPFGTVGEDAIEHLTTVLEAVRKEMRSEGVGGDEEAESTPGDYESDTGPVASSSKVDWEYVTKLAMVERATVRPLEALQEAKEPGQNTVIYITTTEKKSKVVNVSPIEVGAMVGPKLLSLPSVTVTSATIAINNTFDDIKRQLGVGTTSKKVYEGILETPFDYNSQALLYTPKHLPLPANSMAPDDVRAKYYDALSAEIYKLLRSAQGNAFVLFSSTADMREIHARLQQEDLDTPLISQGDDAEAALKEFLKTPKSVILGLKSFWEGVDVVGDKLHLVIITKLPFPNVNDPVIQARSRQYKNDAAARGMDPKNAETAVFQSIMIPAMLTDLRQGAGRLIRSKTDKGVLAILDSRIWTGSSKYTPKESAKNYYGYGGVAVNALGYSQRTSDFKLVDKFLQMLIRQEAARVKKG